MDTKQTVRDPETLKLMLAALDLDPIKIKLMDSDEGEGWTRAHADHVETEYKRFLFLTATNTAPIVPTKETDAFWHQHILDTRKYAEDCDQLFGHFLHHFPYFGMRGAQDAENLAGAFAETKRIYEQAFGSPVPHAGLEAENCSSCGPSSCGGSGCVNSTCTGVSSDVMSVSVRPTFVDQQ